LSSPFSKKQSILSPFSTTTGNSDLEFDVESAENSMEEVEAIDAQQVARCDEAFWNVHAVARSWNQSSESENDASWQPKVAYPQLKDPLPLSMLTPGEHALRPLPAPLPPILRVPPRRRSSRDMLEENYASGYVETLDSADMSTEQHARLCNKALSSARAAFKAAEQQAIEQDVASDIDSASEEDDALDGNPPEMDGRGFKDPLPLSLLTPGEHALRELADAPLNLPLPPQPKLPPPPMRPRSASFQSLHVPTVPPPHSSLPLDNTTGQAWLPPSPTLPPAPW